MSALRIVWPEDDVADADSCDVAEMIVRFDPGHRPVRPPRSDVIERARVLYNNRQCPECRYPVVQPLELDDAAINKCGLPIPGTATLVGFRCRGCQAQWSV